MNEKLAFPGSLHNHSDYSNIRIRDCIIKVGDLIDYAGQLGHSVVALTDHEFTGGWLKTQEAYKSVKEKYPNLKLILGNEIYLCRNGLSFNTFRKNVDKYYHFILLARNEKGARQIQEISTKAWMRSYMSRGMRRVPTYYQDLIDVIGEDKGNIVASSACIGGVVGTQLLKYRETGDKQLLEKIKNWILKINNIFGDGNFYLELQPSLYEEQVYVNNFIIALSEELKIPYIITCDSHYLKRDDREIHKAYLNSQDGDREIDSFYSYTYLMSTDEIRENTRITDGQLATAYINIQKIADSCEEYSLNKPLKIPNLKWNEAKVDENKYQEYLKVMPALEKFHNSEHKADNQLVWNLIDGIEKHDDLSNKESYDEINSNLEITWESSQVNDAEWSAYFLNLQKIVDTCWEAGSIVGPSRGSCGGFLLLYALGVIQINMLREKTRTFAWRFLNPKRVSVLDVDIDIEGSKRQEVLNAFRKEYGNDRVANVATFGTEQSKSAIQTAGRGLGFDNDLTQYISSLIPSDRGVTRSLSECYFGDEDKGFSPIKAFKEEMDKYPEIWKVATKIEGLICRSGVHAGGVIFVDKPFTDSSALMRAPDGTICTQYELHDAEKVSQL